MPVNYEFFSSLVYSVLSIPDLVPAEQVIDIGRQAHMQCLTEERDRATIIWRKDGHLLQSSTRVIANQQTLQIFNLQREDYGVYQCFVSRGTREVQATAQLRLGGTSDICSFTIFHLSPLLLHEADMMLRNLSFSRCCSLPYVRIH